MHDTTLDSLVAARNVAMDTHRALDALRTLAHTQEHLDNDGLSIVETMRPTLEAAYASLEVLNAARPAIKPDGPHFRVIELAMEANSALIPAMLGEPRFLITHWPAFRESLLALLSGDELARLDKAILSEFDQAREKLSEPTVGGMPIELARVAFEDNDLFQRLNKALGKQLLLGIDPADEFQTVAKLLLARRKNRKDRDQVELLTNGTESPKRTEADLLQLDTRKVSLKAPQGVPSLLKNGYEAVADALFQAAEFRLNLPRVWPTFEMEARELSAAIAKAADRYARAETMLRDALDPVSECAHAKALEMARIVNERVGHVMLRVEKAARENHAEWSRDKDAAQAAQFDANADRQHIHAIPPFDLNELLIGMRNQTSRASTKMRKAPFGEESSVGEPATLSGDAGEADEPRLITSDDQSGADETPIIASSEKTPNGEVSAPRGTTAEFSNFALTFTTSRFQILRRVNGAWRQHRTLDVTRRFQTDFCKELVNSDGCVSRDAVTRLGLAKLREKGIGNVDENTRQKAFRRMTTHICRIRKLLKVALSIDADPLPFDEDCQTYRLMIPIVFDVSDDPDKPVFKGRHEMTSEERMSL